MDFAFSEEQEMLRTAARTLLGKASPSSVVRKLMETPDAYDPELWKKTAEQGWTALGIPEQYGGFGSFLDLIVVLEETGRVLGQVDGHPVAIRQANVVAVSFHPELSGETRLHRLLLSSNGRV